MGREEEKERVVERGFPDKSFSCIFRPFYFINLTACRSSGNEADSVLVLDWRSRENRATFSHER